jgi:hypothetical protein
VITGYDIKEAARILAEALVKAAQIQADGRKDAALISQGRK